MREVVIVSAVRTPIGRISGALSAVRPDDLAALVIQEAVARAGIEPALIEEVYLGCANQAGEDNRNVARMATLLAGLPQTVAAVTLNRLCASGLNAVNQAARAIRVGEGDVFVAGGVESMTRAPYSLPKNETPFGPPGNKTAWDTTLGWRYPNKKMAEKFPLEAMGETAENIYELSCAGGVDGGEISREEQDTFALESQARACAAINAGHFAAEIVPVSIPQRRGNPLVVAVDQHPRIRQTETGYALDTSMEKLARLRPAFRAGGTVTAGNSSGLNDGACALVLMSAEKAADLGVQAIGALAGFRVRPGLIRGRWGWGRCRPRTRRWLARDLSLEQIDLAELNEAFAVQSLAVLKQLGLSPANHQRERRRHRPGPSAGLFGRAHS